VSHAGATGTRQLAYGAVAPGRKPGPPVHDDLVERQFTAAAPNRLWLTDITEHPTAEGKLYHCAVEDACSRAVGSEPHQRRAVTRA
jgi:transposase InsO family protein